MAANLFNCQRCPAYCCSYAHIGVNKMDLRRLARHFGIDPTTAYRRFTKKGLKKDERILRHKQDEHFGSVCRFLDVQSRECTIYIARPKICRDFPGTRRCGYYDFLTFERRLLNDPNHVATTHLP